MAAPAIRLASDADVEAIAEVGVAGWVEFAPIVPAEIDPREVWDPERLRARIAAERGEVERAVAELEGELVGFIGYGTGRDEDAPADAGEIRVLYVHPDHWRRGVGSALVEHAATELGRRGFREVTLWAAAESRRGRAFYESAGFVHDGALQTRERFEAVEVRYRRRLPD